MCYNILVKKLGMNNLINLMDNVIFFLSVQRFFLGLVLYRYVLVNSIYVLEIMLRFLVKFE